MYCRNCGTQVPDEASVCWKCGNKLFVQQPQIEAEASSAKTAIKTSTAVLNTNVLALGAGILVGVVVLVLWGLWGWRTGSVGGGLILMAFLTPIPYIIALVIAAFGWLIALNLLANKLVSQRACVSVLVGSVVLACVGILAIPGVPALSRLGEENIWGDYYTKTIYKFYNSLSLSERASWRRETMFTIFNLETRRFSTALNVERNKQYDPGDNLLRKEAIPGFARGGQINKMLDNQATWTIDQKITGLALEKATENEGIRTAEDLKKRLIENGYKEKEADILVTIYRISKGEQVDKPLSELLSTFQQP